MRKGAAEENKTELDARIVGLTAELADAQYNLDNVKSNDEWEAADAEWNRVNDLLTEANGSLTAATTELEEAANNFTERQTEKETEATAAAAAGFDPDVEYQDWSNWSEGDSLTEAPAAPEGGDGSADGGDPAPADGGDPPAQSPPQ